MTPIGHRRDSSGPVLGQRPAPAVEVSFDDLKYEATRETFPFTARPPAAGIAPTDRLGSEELHAIRCIIATSY